MSKTSKIIAWIVGIVVVVLIVISLSKGTTNNGPIKIGFIGPLTGDASNIGQNAKAAVDVAVSEINAAGGIQGRQLQVVYEDGKCNGTDASSAANKLINIDKVPVIFGGACSGETSSFAKTAVQSNTVVFSYCSSAPALSKAGIFRDYPSDNYQGSFAADYIYNTLGKKKIAILYVNTDWGTGIQGVFAAELNKLGGQVVLNEGFDQNTHDVRTLLAKVKAANPDAVYFLGYTNESIVALNQAKDVGLKTTWFGADAWDDSKIWTTVGSAGEGAMYSKVSSKPSDAFKSALAAKVGTNEIAACTPTAYDGLKVLAQVINKVGTDPTAIKSELHNTVYNGGISSDKISFDQNGDLVGANYTIMKVANGVATPVTQQ